MRQHEVPIRHEIDVDKYSFGTGLWFLKVFKIISGATNAISTVIPMASTRQSEKVNAQVNCTSLIAPKRRTMLWNLMHITLTMAIPAPPIARCKVINSPTTFQTVEKAMFPNVSLIKSWFVKRIIFTKIMGPLRKLMACSNNMRSSTCRIVLVVWGLDFLVRNCMMLSSTKVPRINAIPVSKNRVIWSFQEKSYFFLIWLFIPKGGARSILASKLWMRSSRSRKMTVELRSHLFVTFIVTSSSISSRNERDMQLTEARPQLQSSHMVEGNTIRDDKIPL